MSDPKTARCFDKHWKYTKSESTDLRALFNRVRRQLAEAQAVKQEPKVRQLKPARKEAP